MGERLARLRPDVEVRPDPDHPEHFLLQHPDTRRFARFTFEQAAVLLHLDGTRSAEELAAAASSHTGSDITPGQVTAFLSNLEAAGLLGSAHRAASPRPRPAPAFGGGLLSIKIYSFNPDRMLTVLERKLRICFTSTFALTAGICVAAAAAVSAANSDALFSSLMSLVSIYSLPLVVVVALIVMSIHELGHGLALKHFGGRVEEMGLLVLYFIPAFYCNLDETWRLERRQRVLVSLAGGYVQLIVWAVATVAWRILAPETWGSRVCLVVIAFSGIQTLFNFNPLLRLDGYYILSDLMRMPNLRQRSFGYIRRLLASLLAASPYPRDVTGRERRVCLLYGVSALAFSGAVLWLMLDRIGTWLVQEYGGWGIVGLAMIVLLATPVPRRRPLPADGDSPQPRSAWRRWGPRIAAVITLAVIALLPWELKVSGDFTVLPQERETVNTKVEGTLVSVHVDEGSRVRKGDLLAEIENLDLSNGVEETRRELEARVANLDLLRAGPRKEEIERARRVVDTKQSELEAALRVQQERTVLQEAVERREAEVRNAERNFRRSKQLYEQGLVPRSDVERDETDFQVHQKQLAEAQGELRVLEERTSRSSQVKRRELDHARSELAVLLAGTRTEAIREADAQVSKLGEKLKNMNNQLAFLTVRSTIDGVVATRDLRNRIGQYVTKGAHVCEIVSDSTVIIDMPVPEKEIADVREEFPITLKVRGYPGLSFEARVKSIGAVASEQGREPTVGVRGTLPNPDGLLKPGMTGVGKILCGKRLIGSIATRRLVRWLRTEFWEYLP